MAEEKEKKAEVEEATEGKLTLCLDSCYVGKRYYRKGEFYLIDEGEEYARHFKIPDTARKKLEKAAAEAKAAAKK